LFIIFFQNTCNFLQFFFLNVECLLKMKGT
ncbi:hypothetical protein, partial [Plasmodium yoelii yoelii]